MTTRYRCDNDAKEEDLIPSNSLKPSGIRGVQTTRFCVVRHGETDWNANRKVQGQLDVQLSATGHAQACAMAKRVGLGELAAIYTSDLCRARHTAEAVACRIGLQPETRLDLRERHYGIFQGLTYDEARKRFPDELVRHSGRDPDFTPSGGENLFQFADRVIRCVSELEEKHREHSILVVTHGGVLDILYRYATGESLSAPRNFEIPNAALNWFEISGGCWSVSVWADRSHLAETIDESPGVASWPV